MSRLVGDHGKASERSMISNNSAALPPGPVVRPTRKTIQHTTKGVLHKEAGGCIFSV